MIDKFAISFHETFTLSRSSLAQIIENCLNNGRLKRNDLVKMGTNYQKAMPRYARRTGLLGPKDDLTPLGHFIGQYDPTLSRTGTQWLLHYHLAAPQGFSAFWHHFVHRHFLPSNSFSANDLITDLNNFLTEHKGKAPAANSVRSTVAIFTGTYLKPDGLAKLDLLEDNDSNTYYVPPTRTPDLWALGYALVDYWAAHYGERLTINLDDLTHGDFAAIFILGEERLLQLLIQLKQEGMLDLFRTSRPYQVVLLQPNPEFALRKLYGVS